MRRVVLAIALVTLELAGCGPQPTTSPDEQKRVAAFDAQRAARAKAVEERTAALSALFTAVNFPSKKLGEGFRTIQVQDFFKSAGGKPVIFHANNDDVALVGTDIVADFSVVVGASFSGTGQTIHLKLKVTPGISTVILNVPVDQQSVISSLVREPNFIVVAKIDRVERIRDLQKVNGSTPDAGSVLEVNPGLVATGTALAIEAP